jgi:hypothetical protein
MSNTRPSISVAQPKTLSSEERAARLEKVEAWSEKPAREALGESRAPAEQKPPTAPARDDHRHMVAAPAATPPKSMHVRMPIDTYEMLRDIAHVTREHMNDIIARATLKECRRIREALEKGK